MSFPNGIHVTMVAHRQMQSSTDALYTTLQEFGSVTP